MSKPKSPARPPLEVTIMFEPTRLAATHWVDAYAQVVPLRLRAAPVPAATPPVEENAVEENAVTLTSGGCS
jgi:hypothetical protein